MKAIAIANACRNTYKQKPELYPEWKDITAYDIVFDKQGNWVFNGRKFNVVDKKPRGIEYNTIEDNTGRVFYMYGV